MLEIPRVEEGGHIGPVNSALVPRYGGESTYALLPRLRDIEAADRKAGIKVVGVPFDSGVSYRPGARFGSNHVRQSSRLLRPYNPATNTSPFAQTQVVDAGDMAVNPFNINEAIESIEQDALDLTADGSSLLTIGGDHTIALPLLRAASKRAKEPVALLHFDAHLDTWNSYFAARAKKASWIPKASAMWARAGRSTARRTSKTTAGLGLALSPPRMCFGRGWMKSSLSCATAWASARCISPSILMCSTQRMRPELAPRKPAG